MHLHILGICGTFMGGIAALAQSLGHRVTGCDTQVYPPMSTQLASLGIDIVEGWAPDQVALRPDVFVIGNVVSRGNPLMEAILDQRLPYQSGPSWLSDHVLRERRVIAVAGTHGKTTTSSLVAHLLQQAGHEPGFLIGGVPGNFERSARLGRGEWFVVEADEYDTAFFDKRAKFVHYRPEIAVLNNLEFDHADIYTDLAAIEWQFHQLLRIVPGSGTVVANAADEALARVLAAGCWTPIRYFEAPAALSSAAEVALDFAERGDHIRARIGGAWRHFAWRQQGAHNLQNTAAAVTAANAAGVALDAAFAALGGFASVKRRLELIADAGGIRVYDDFAHHPTAIRMTLDGLAGAAQDGRLLVAFEPRSNTMRQGVHADALAPAFADADRVYVLRPPALDWDMDAAFASLSNRARVFDDVGALQAAIEADMRAGDRVVLMSNGGFGGLSASLARAVKEMRGG